MKQLYSLFLFGFCVYGIYGGTITYPEPDPVLQVAQVTYEDEHGYDSFGFSCPPCYKLNGTNYMYCVPAGFFGAGSVQCYPTLDWPTCEYLPPPEQEPIPSPSPSVTATASSIPSSTPLPNCPKEEISYNCSIAPPPTTADDDSVILVDIICTCKQVVLKYCCNDSTHEEDEVMTRTWDFYHKEWSESPKCELKNEFIPPPILPNWELARCIPDPVREYNCPHAPAPSITGQNLVIHVVACLPSYVEVQFCCKSFCNVFPEGSPRSMAYDFATKTWSQEPTCGIIPLRCPSVTITSGSPIRVTYSDLEANKTCGSYADFTCGNGGIFIGSRRDVCGWGSDSRTGRPFPKWLSAKDQESYSRTNPTPPGSCVVPKRSCPRGNPILCGKTSQNSTAVTWEAANGWSLDGPGSATCRADGTWSSPAPKCVHCICNSYTPSVSNGVVKRVKLGNGCNYRYNVTCNKGYEPFGPVTYECGSTGTTPRFRTMCIPEGSCGGCLPLPVVSNSKVTRFIGTWTPAYCVSQIFYECDPGCTIQGGTVARCLYRSGSVRLSYNPPSCDC